MVTLLSTRDFNWCQIEYKTNSHHSNEYNDLINDVSKWDKVKGHETNKDSQNSALETLTK